MGTPKTTGWNPHRFDDIGRDARDVGDDLIDAFDMKGGLLRSAYYDDARGGASGKKISVLWMSYFVLYPEWETLVFSDLALAIFSMLFVALWLRVHVKSTCVAAVSMAQIVLSMPITLFFYRFLLQIPYFSPMQILAIFVVLGIGADDVFVYSDAWKQSDFEVPRFDDDDAAARLERRVAFAYGRALQAIFNTSFTTAFAFFATAISPIMPLSTFGIFAAIAILVNYGLVMTVTPAVWVLAEPRGARKRRCCCGGAAEDAPAGRLQSPEMASRRYRPSLDDDDDFGLLVRPQRLRPCAILAAVCCRAKRDDARAPRRSLSTRAVDGYVALLARRYVGAALVSFMLLGGVGLAVAASRLRPPKAVEDWLPPRHMFTRAMRLSEDGYDANLAERYPTVTLAWGLDHLTRPKFSRYVPSKHRGDVHFSEPLRLFEADAQAQIRAGKGCEIPNFKGSYLGRFPLVSADFWTRDHLSERSRP